MHRYEFPRQSRLLKPADFSFVFKAASIKGQHKSCLFLARPNNLPGPRIGFVIAKRNVRLACNRNRIKRLLRDQFRLKQHNLPAIDIVVVARKPVAEMDNGEMRSMINKLFSELNRKYAKISSAEHM